LKSQLALPLAGGPSPIAILREETRSCRRCDLWQRATQSVFGEGPEDASLVLVGEQPGDSEDVAGRPFVGPAGRVLDRALHAVGIDRTRVYVTNVVKHFKWEPRGKRRLHSKPNGAEIDACRFWLDHEIATLRPNVLVCLGATAAQAILGPHFRVTKTRGSWMPSPLAPNVLATVHPSSILRERDESKREAAFQGLVADLAVVAKRLRDGGVG
jgi:uracil-DNA glycosylase family protein